MSEQLPQEVLQNSTAMSLARAVTVDERRARERGVVPEENFLTVTQSTETDSLVWRFNFEPKRPPFVRGGDYMVDVDPVDGSIRKELWGQ